ncbi:MAG: ABC-F family ATP-binding cassette domain-containing protein [Bacteroidales bacterium]|jgi:ATP-binding cassette subfamily F protein uup|nr:ABC-F family ATP-binding cassette domain-containing protein [Bacteroidales bacterium]
MADALLTIENLTKSFGDKLLFEDISFGVNAGQKTALIARNGYGKSTLLNIITGKELPDSGKVTFRGDTKMAYLPQNPDFHAHQTVRSFVEAAERPENVESWDFEQRISEVLSRLEVDKLMDRPMDSLSGGEQKKVALSRILIDDTNLLLLDEPTNHLDIAMIEWLEDFLGKQRLAILMVTHDRYFLDHVCDDIIELDNSQIYLYRSSRGDTDFHRESPYSYYLEKKAEREYNERAEVEKAKSQYRTELEWMRRMPQARGTKARARIDTFYELEQKAHTRFEKERAELSVKTERIGGKILELYNVCKSFDGRKLVDDFSFTFKRGEKIGIVGPNGIGKSTFLSLITEQLRPDSGRVIVGQTIQFGIYSQSGMKAKDDMRVIDIIREVADVIELDNGKEMSAHQFLSYFGFDDMTQYNYYGNLSGGERRRLYLLTVLMANPNFLILDEPTNDLDIYTLNILERFLIGYKGCLVIVSHDRSFMDNIVDHLFVFEGDGRIRDYHSNYSDYQKLRQQQERERQRQKKEEKPRYERSRSDKPKATFKQQKEYEQLSTDIDSLSQERQELEQLLSGGTTNPEQITQASQRIGEIIAQLDEKELRWLELDEIINPTK